MRTILISLAAFLVLSGQTLAFECNVCHSKNPAMVRMHQALKGQGCFGCHKVGAGLRGKGLPKDWEGLLKQRQTAELCLPCHARRTKGEQEITDETDSTTRTAR